MESFQVSVASGLLFGLSWIIIALSFCGFQLERTKHLFDSSNFMYELLIATIADYLKVHVVPLLNTCVTS